jgi:hypothetical protein
MFKAGRYPGANPTITSYNAIVVKNYNATTSKAQFKNTNFFPAVHKNALSCYNAGGVVVNLRIVGLGPGSVA